MHGPHPLLAMVCLFVSILQKETLHASFINGITSVGVREGGSINILNIRSKNDFFAFDKAIL